MLLDTGEIINKIAKTVKGYVTNKSFYLGGILAVGIFSQYIFGADNLAEQIAEKVFESTTGQQVDFSPEQEATEDAKTIEVR